LYMNLGFNPKWIIPFGIILGVLIGGLMIALGDLLFGLVLMILIVLMSFVMYFLFRREINRISSDSGMDLMGILDMDQGSLSGGMAEVVSVESTGEYVNNEPEFILILKISVAGREPFEVEHKQALKNETSVSVGAKMPVMFDKKGNVQLILNEGGFKVINPKELIK
jgi:hypothetical protein